MKRRSTIKYLIAIVLLALACFIVIILALHVGERTGTQNPEPLEQIEVTSAEPYPAQIVKKLELGWGNGKYEVGYINDAFEKSVESNSIYVGPQQFCIDVEGAIYIDDTMNYRYLKYDKDGAFIGEVARKRFPGNEDVPVPWAIIGGIDRMYMYSYGNSTFYSYCFETDELLSFTVPENDELDFRLNRLEIDPRGNVFIFGRDSSSLRSPAILYEVDSSLTRILDRRVLPVEWGTNISNIDEEGNVYYASEIRQPELGATLYKIDDSNNISEMFTVYYKNVQVVEGTDEPPFICLGTGTEQFLFTKNGEAIEKLTVLNPYQQDSPPDPYYYMHSRPYTKDDKSPFCIYKLEIGWEGSQQQ